MIDLLPLLVDDVNRDSLLVEVDADVIHGGSPFVEAVLAITILFTTHFKDSHLSASASFIVSPAFSRPLPTANSCRKLELSKDVLEKARQSVIDRPTQELVSHFAIIRKTHNDVKTIVDHPKTIVLAYEVLSNIKACHHILDIAKFQSWLYLLERRYYVISD